MRITALLVVQPVDIRYLTGFVGDDSWLLVPARGKPVILSDARFEEEIERTAVGARKVIRKGPLSEALAKLVQKAGIEKLGLQADHITLAMRRAVVKQLRASAVREVHDGLVMQRAVKDAHELRCIRRAVDVAQQAFETTLNWLRPGQTEGQLAAFLDHTMRDLGATGPSFTTIVAADSNSSLPHALPGSRKLKRGGFVLIDFGAFVDGYCSDLTRVVPVTGKLPKRIQAIYDIALEAQLAAIDAIRPGAQLKAVDQVARSIIEKAGYGKQFGHGLGHGIGLEIHEQPSLSWRSKGVLEAGQVVTVEPGIYLPGIGGVRIEDDVLVTGTGTGGRKVLTSLPK